MNYLIAVLIWSTMTCLLRWMNVKLVSSLLLHFAWLFLLQYQCWSKQQNKYIYPWKAKAGYRNFRKTLQWSHIFQKVMTYSESPWNFSSSCIFIFSFVPMCWKINRVKWRHFHNRIPIDYLGFATTFSSRFLSFLSL
jgi:hypothetical protein